MNVKLDIRQILKEETNESLLDDLGNFFKPNLRNMMKMVMLLSYSIFINKSIFYAKNRSII